MVLFVFLALSVLISTLLARATDRAEAAEAREAELRTLQELSADLVTSLAGRETHTHMLQRLIRLFEFRAASLHFHERLFGEAAEPVTVGADDPVETRTGTPPPQAGPRSDSRSLSAGAGRGVPADRGGPPVAAGGRLG